VHACYLHGFASSGASGKAAYFAGRFAAVGVDLYCPDLNEPDFATLTTTRMIGQVAGWLAGLAPGPVLVIGSSLGAFVAWHAAAREPGASRITHLVLLAPAFDVGTRPLPTLGEAGMRAWRETGETEIFHYAYNEPRRLRYDLFADAGRYDSMRVAPATPTLVVQGRRDTIVDPAMVQRIVRGREHVRLLLVDDDHQLQASVETIWDAMVSFVGPALASGAGR
jgi:pimeloyl-ACP methyl ester carboxylesterase